MCIHGIQTFPVQAISASTSNKMASFDVKLIPEFDGTGDVVDWIEKVEMVCKLQQPAADLVIVIPLRLRGGASAVYRQLSEEDRRKADKVKAALRRAFAVDKYAAYELFSARRLRPGESVDVYLAELQRLSTLFGGLSEEGLGCAFVAGLPDSVKQMLRAGARMESLTLSEIVDRSRAVLREECNVSQAAAAALVRRGTGDRSQGPNIGRRERGPCFLCGRSGHIARDCTTRGGGVGGARGVRCFRCDKQGHVVAQCPENEEREVDRAPASSRD